MVGYSLPQNLAHRRHRQVEEMDIRLAQVVDELGRVEDGVVFRRWDDPPVGVVQELHKMRDTVFQAARANGVPMAFDEMNKLSAKQLDELLSMKSGDFVRMIVAIKRALIEERKERKR